MKSYSSIQVSNETKRRLKDLSITPTETFENIILRLLDVNLNGREIDYSLEDKHSSLNILLKVDWGKPDKNILFYDSDGDLHEDIMAPAGEYDVNVWEVFKDNVLGLDNLVNILAVLDLDESIDAGEFVISRVS